MLLRFKTVAGLEVNLNAAHVQAFVPTDEGGSRITLVSGLPFDVTDSCRTIRHQMKKAYSPVTEDTKASEDQATI